MKILWIYPELPYPLTSGMLRGYHLLRELGKRHAVTFLALTHRWPIPAETMPALQSCAERVQLFATHGAPEPAWLKTAGSVPAVGWRLREAYSTHWAVQQLQAAVRSLLASEHFDVVLFNGRETIPVLEAVHVPLAVDIGDTNHERMRQQIRYASLKTLPSLLYRYTRLRYEERLLARMSPHRSFISARDRENLLGPDDRSNIVPQGIDYEYWKRTAPSSRQNCIVFSGVMNYAPNQDAALFLIDKILPLVRRTVSRLQVFIVGRDPSQQLLNAASRHKDVTVTGAVEDVRPWLERADVYVAALRFASGVQNKVLEAMAMEIPVVTTPVVAAGLHCNDVEPPLVVGDTAADLAAGVIRLLTSDGERARLASAGRHFIETHCSWSASADRLEHMCMAAAGLAPAYHAAEPL